MINVGIIGYGNVGKALEKELIKSSEFNLIAVFSKQGDLKTLPYTEVLAFKNKIEVLFVCVGSQSDLEKVVFDLAKHFNIVECYDNHSKLKSYHNKLQKILALSKKVVLSACGWDPGLFSVARAFISALQYEAYTFWGKGVSQGHTQAIKNIPEVKDAIQFTIPNSWAKHKVKKGKQVNKLGCHSRLCYVVCEKKDRAVVKSKIVTMKNYFVGYKTKVKFVNQTTLNKIKNLKHKGSVIAKGNEIELKLNLKSNPQFTSKIMLCFARVVYCKYKNKMFGVYTIFDFSIKDLLQNKSYKYL